MKKLIIGLIVLVLVLIVVVIKVTISNAEKDSDTRKYINNTTMVYFVAGASKGDHYHREGCQYFNSIYRGRTLYTVDVSTAQEMGLIPCPDCNPPKPLLSKKEKEKEKEEIIKLKQAEQKEMDNENRKEIMDYINGKKNTKSNVVIEFVPKQRTTPVQDYYNNLKNNKK